LWAGVVGALLDEHRSTGSVRTVREARGGMRFALIDGLKGSPRPFRKSDTVRAIAAAARAWAYGSDKLRDRVATATGLCRGINGVTSLKPALAGVGVDCSGGRMAGT
jgi:hypothetical protein